MSVQTFRRTIGVVHVAVETSKPFRLVCTALEKTVPTIDAEIPALLEDWLTDRLKQRLDAAPELSVSSRDCNCRCEFIPCRRAEGARLNGET